MKSEKFQLQKNELQQHVYYYQDEILNHNMHYQDRWQKSHNYMLC